MKWKKEKDEVLYQQGNKLVLIDAVDMESLKKIACRNQRKRARFCAHNDISAPVHEMFIFHRKETYVRPHKHLSKAESFHLVEGEADVLLFDEQGNLKKIINLGKYESGKCFFYRIPESCYHTQIFKQDTIFHEVTKGPFEKNDTVFPSWAPPDDKHHLVNEYIRQLNLQLELLTH
jgi:cupin fold WbuC family metalloprotein|tara:strand:- start:1187 stop:1714 length:528 start_codon:yes stop_codon:yes gene_type:complete